MVEIKFNEIIEIDFSHLFLCLVKLAKLKFEINHQNDPKDPSTRGVVKKVIC